MKSLGAVGYSLASYDRPRKPEPLSGLQRAQDADISGGVRRFFPLGHVGSRLAPGRGRSRYAILTPWSGPRERPLKYTFSDTNPPP
jgi:hypothetical protein